MPWRESTRVDERTRFVEAYLSGHFQMAELCRAAGISRPTGYLWLDRYRRFGEAGLADRSRRPWRSPQRTPAAVLERVVALRRQHPTWGPRKLRAYAQRHWPEQSWPSRSCIALILRNAGLAKRPRRRLILDSPGQPARTPAAPNALWTMDFMGEFRMGNTQYCYPFTLGDLASRYALDWTAMPRICGAAVEARTDRAFAEYGLPEAIHSDGGAPFASVGLGRLSRLSLKWLKLGIRLERNRPGCPQDNASHERLHRTLRAEAARPPEHHLLAQQRRFDRLRDEYNHERPHESLGDRPPAEFYRPSPRPVPARLPTPAYPGHFEVRRISRMGELRFKGDRTFFGIAFAREYIGLEEVEDGLWSVYFFDQMLARFDEHLRRLIEVPV